jgi:hypothetical protein
LNGQLQATDVRGVAQDAAGISSGVAHAGAVELVSAPRE